MTMAPPVAWMLAGPPQSSGTIASRLQPFVESHSLAGAVTLVATKDQVLDMEAVGFADIATKNRMKPDALFWIASQSKPMTAAGFMMLVDEGKVSLDRCISKLLVIVLDYRVLSVPELVRGHGNRVTGAPDFGDGAGVAAGLD